MEGVRIVHVVCGEGFAGTERYVCTVAAAQQAAGAVVDVVGGAVEPMRSQLGPAGVSHVPARSVLDAARALLRFGSPDVVHTHLTAADVAGAAMKRRVGGRLVSTRHIAAPRGSRRGARVVCRWAAKEIDVQVAISRFVAGRVEGESVVLHDPVPDSEAGRRDAKVILVAQRLEEEKDTPTAVHAFASSGLANEGWTLEIAGEGSERRNVERAVQSHGLGNSVRLLGRVDDLDARRKAAAVFLATATEEPFGLSVVEAMAAGIPVVASAAGGHLETVGEVASELMFAPGDHHAAGAILDRVAHQREWAATIGDALRRDQQERFSMARHLEGLRSAYQSVLSSAP